MNINDTLSEIAIKVIVALIVISALSPILRKVWDALRPSGMSAGAMWAWRVVCLFGLTIIISILFGKEVPSPMWGIFTLAFVSLVILNASEQGR